MCFFIAANFDALSFAKRRGLDTAVYEKMIRYLAEQEQLFVRQQAKLPAAKRKRPKFFEFNIAEKVFNVPAYEKPLNVIVGPDRRLQVMRWGLKPRNASPAKLEQYARQNWFVNANGERIFTEKTYPYYQLIQSHDHTATGGRYIPAQRCLIGATGFIEYHWFSDKNKQPYYIEFPDRPEFMMAGLYEVTPIPGKAGHPGGGMDLSNPDYENYYYTYVQITTDGTPEMDEIHNGGNNPHRMPMILREQDEAAWLDPATPIEKIKEMIRPYDEFPIKAWPIDKNFRFSNPLAEETIQEIPIQNELNLNFDEH